jgi:hypothetical protein
LRYSLAIIAIVGLVRTASSADAGPSRDIGAFCAANPNKDFPAKAFYGPKFQFGMTPKEVARRGANDWRCMDGKVWICNVGADGRACEKLDPDPKPSEPVRQFCAANPGADFVPMVVIGNSATTWRCRGVTAEPLETQRLDKRNFIKKAWRPLPP